MDYVVWFELVLFAVMMGLSAFFSSSETSLFSLRDVQLEQMRRDRHPRVELIQRLLSEPRRLIITILIGNELVNVTASVISAAVVIRLLGVESKWVNLLVMVPLLLLLGEITPKALAIRHNVAFAGLESGPINAFARLIKPLRWVIRKIADRIITLFIGRERSRGNIITEDMVRVLAKEALGEGALDHLEAQYIEQIFDFGNKTLGDVLTPRSDIFFLSLDAPLKQVAKHLCETRHTKVPVYGEHKDDIAGILHARDLLGVEMDNASPDPDTFRRLLREPYFVPETKLAADLFHSFRERKQSVALTVDEYGGVTGLVTMEDLLECIFGEIHSPSDEQHAISVKDPKKGRYTVEGGIPISEFNSEMGSDFSQEWGETIGGLVLHHYGELPPEGAEIEIERFRFVVMEVEDNRIKTLEFEVIPEDAQSKEAVSPPSGLEPPRDDGVDLD
jgi:putative hemolysin